jgi:hypothetical protein
MGPMRCPETSVTYLCCAIPHKSGALKTSRAECCSRNIYIFKMLEVPIELHVELLWYWIHILGHAYYRRFWKLRNLFGRQFRIFLTSPDQWVLKHLQTCQVAILPWYTRLHHRLPTQHGVNKNWGREFRGKNTVLREVALSRQHVRVKHPWIYARLHGVTSQKMELFNKKLNWKWYDTNMGSHFNRIEMLIMLDLWNVKTKTVSLSWGMKFFGKNGNFPLQCMSDLKDDTKYCMYSVQACGLSWFTLLMSYSESLIVTCSFNMYYISACDCTSVSCVQLS